MLGLQPAMENTDPIPGAFEPSYNNMQDDAATAKILGLGSMAEDDDDGEMPEGDSPDEDSGFYVDHSIYHQCRDRLRELREEPETEGTAIHRRTDGKGMALI
jgi:hypothetical protein